LQTGVRAARGQKSQCYCHSLLNWNRCSKSGILFTIFGPTTLISSSKSAGANRINFLYRPKILGTSNLLTNWYYCTQSSFCTTPFTISAFLEYFFFWTTRDVQILRPP